MGECSTTSPNSERQPEIHLHFKIMILEEFSKVSPSSEEWSDLDSSKRTRESLITFCPSTLPSFWREDSRLSAPRRRLSETPSTSPESSSDKNISPLESRLLPFPPTW